MKIFYQNVKKTALKSCLLSGLIIASGVPAFSQAPDFQWKKAYGGNNKEAAYSVQQTGDGGFIFAGTSASADGDVGSSKGEGDVWVVKTNAAGDILWKTVLGGSGFDEARNVQQTKDGGYVIVGNTSSIDGDVVGNHPSDDGGVYADVWVVKLTAAGAKQWTKCLGGNYDDKGFSIKQTSDDGYIVVGSTASTNGDVSGNHNTDGFFTDFWVVKISNGGTFTWQKTFGGTGNDAAKSVALTADGGYIVAGDTESSDQQVTGNHGGADMWVLKINSLGENLIAKTFGGTLDDHANYIKVTSDGGYILAGDSYSNNGDLANAGARGGQDAILFKLTADRNITWKKAYGGTNADIAYSVEPTTDAGYIIGAYTGSTNGDVSGAHAGGEMWAVKTKGDGTLEWQKPMGGRSGEQGYSAMQTTDGGFIIAGESNSEDGDVTGNHGNAGDAWIVKLQPSIVTPLTLLSFNAAKQNNQVMLTWITTNEQNTSNFTIERSSNGVAFSAVAKVNSLGNTTSAHTYTVTDDVPLAGKNYYRLKSTDKDGSSSLSAIIQLVFNKDGSITIQPNPVKNLLRILWQYTQANNATVQVTDLAGKIVATKNVVLVQGENNISLSTQSLPAGTYMARMIAGSEVKVIKFVKE